MHSPLRTLAILVAVSSSLSSLSTPATAQARVERLTLGPLLDKDSDYVVSPRGQRLACAIGTADGRGAIVVDGEQQAAFDGLHDPRMVIVSMDLEITWQSLLEARKVRSSKRPGPVVFSDDGTRYAYAVRRGQETVVVVDGQDLWSGADTVSGLDFAPHTKHFHHMRHPRSGDQQDGFQLIVDGKAERPSYLQPFPVFSPDGEHYAYVATDLDRATHHLIVDGVEADYLGLKPIWTASNQLVTVSAPDPQTYAVTLQLDGKKVLEAPFVERVIPAPAGRRVATIVRANKGHQLYLDAEQVLAGPLVDDIHWSADGKRYAAVCNTGKGTHFLLLDGQAGPEYGGITGVTFSPDGSGVHFVGYTNGQHMLVLDNSRQSPPATMPIEASPLGDGSFAYVLGKNLHEMTLVVGGEQLGPVREIQGLTLSASGRRYAATFGGANNGSVLVDGMVFDDVEPEPFGTIGLDIGHLAAGIFVPEIPYFVFSPDDKHLAYLGWFKANTKAMGVFVDDVLIPTRSTHVSRVQFTPDSQHLIWTERVKPHLNVVLDGQIVAQFDLISSSYWERHQHVAAMGADGTFTIMGVMGASIVRLSITPDPATSVDAMVEAAR